MLFSNFGNTQSNIALASLKIQHSTPQGVKEVDMDDYVQSRLPAYALLFASLLLIAGSAFSSFAWNELLFAFMLGGRGS